MPCTLREAVAEAQRALGVAEATAVTLTFADGTSVNIASDKNPLLDQPVPTGAKITPRTSAAAGLV